MRKYNRVSINTSKERLNNQNSRSESDNKNLNKETNYNNNKFNKENQKSILTSSINTKNNEKNEKSDRYNFNIKNILQKNNFPIIVQNEEKEEEKYIFMSKKMKDREELRKQRE